MISFISKRILLGFPVVFGVVSLTFIFMYIIPGDPVRVMVGDYYNEKEIEVLREELGLNENVATQYINYLTKIIKADFGKSYITQKSVLSSLIEKFPYTLQLALFAMAFAILFGVLLGVLSGIYYGRWLDKLFVFFSLFGASAPVFWVALLMIMIVGIWLQLLPPTGYGGFKFIILPATVLGFRSTALLCRTTRAYMLEIMKEDYVVTAKAKGLSPIYVIGKHVMKNILIPIITIIAADFGSYLSGAVLTESIFGWPGIGRFLLDAIMKRDFPVIQGTVLFIALIFVFINILVDVIYGIIDPRTRKYLYD
mgnify:CR=1 FL=1